MIRFLHSSDLHLGRPFGRFPEDVRGRLKQARHDSLSRLAGAARQGGAAVILLAGDTFDAQTPAPDVLRQALNEMAGAPDLTWVLMPGNHDSLAASELWRTVQRDRPGNVTLALTPDPINLAPGAVLLPAPCTTRNPGRDLTLDMDRPTPEGAMRIGLGHGPITDFAALDGVEDSTPGIIPPDRAALSGLDYLALGDWHGRIGVNARTWYSGTPEADSFKHPGPAGALLVAVDGPGAVPDVTCVETGIIDWAGIALDLLPGDDVAEMLRAALPDLGRRRDTLARLVPAGRLKLRARAQLEAQIAYATPDFLWLDADLSGLGIDHDAADLDLIDRAGALRSAAETLVDRADDTALSADQRAVAATALSLLFGFAAEDT